MPSERSYPENLQFKDLSRDQFLTLPTVTSSVYLINQDSSPFILTSVDQQQPASNLDSFNPVESFLGNVYCFLLEKVVPTHRYNIGL